MRPMIKRVSHAVRNSTCPFLKLFPIGGIPAGNERLVYTVGAHRTPFVVVAFEPYSGKVLEFMVVCHIFRIEVTMIVYNGLVFSILMIQTLRNRCLEEEILVDKWFHTGCMVFTGIYDNGTASGRRRQKPSLQDNRSFPYAKIK